MVQAATEAFGPGMLPTSWSLWTTAISDPPTFDSRNPIKTHASVILACLKTSLIFFITVTRGHTCLSV